MLRRAGGFLETRAASGTRNFSTELSFNKFTKEDYLIIWASSFVNLLKPTSTEKFLFLDAAVVY